MLRSLLFVPAKANTINKIGTLGADAYIIDLEDSIEAEKKEEALGLVEHFLEKYDFSLPIFVRLNAETYDKEIKCLKKFPKLGFMLPKFESPIYYEKHSDIWNIHEIIALVESPMGIVRMPEIAQCRWVDAIAFGAEDYTSKANMENATELLRYQKGCLLTYAKAYEKSVYDTPSFQINSHDAFEKDVKESVRLGFDGKLVISPRHVEFVNETFNRMSDEEIMDIVVRYEATDEAVQIIDGKVYEKMHIERLKMMLKSKREQNG